jgi:hypothetical protein
VDSKGSTDPDLFAGGFLTEGNNFKFWIEGGAFACTSAQSTGCGPTSRKIGGLSPSWKQDAAALLNCTPSLVCRTWGILFIFTDKKCFN